MNTQGQAVNSEQEEFTAFLINILQPSSKEDFEKKIMSLSEDDIKELYRQFKQAKNQTVMAKNGLKFDILSNYRGRCPEGTEMFMDGGCIKCRDKKNKIKIKQDGGEMKKRFEMGPGDTDSANKARPNKLQKKVFRDTKKERFCSGGRASKYQQGGGFRILPAPDVEQIKPSEVLINRYKNSYTNYVGEPSTASTTVYTDIKNPESQAVVTENSNDIFPVEAGYQTNNGYQSYYPTNSQISNEERLTNQARSVAREYQAGGDVQTTKWRHPLSMITQFTRFKAPTDAEAGYIQATTGINPHSRFILPTMPDVDISTVSEPDLAQVLREIRGINPATSTNNSNTETIPTQQPAARTTQPAVQQQTTPAQQSTNLTFAQAFAQARKNGLSVFDWNGKSYTTELAQPNKVQSTVANTRNINQGISNQALPMQLAPMNHQSISRIDAIKNRFARKQERQENRQERRENRLNKKISRVQKRFS